MKKLTKAMIAILSTFAISSVYAQCPLGGCGNQGYSGNYWGGYNPGSYSSGYRNYPYSSPSYDSSTYGYSNQGYYQSPSYSYQDGGPMYDRRPMGQHYMSNQGYSQNRPYDGRGNYPSSYSQSSYNPGYYDDQFSRSQGANTGFAPGGYQDSSSFNQGQSYPSGGFNPPSR